jgi:uncharacterized protein (TIGR00369 family)
MTIDDVWAEAVSGLARTGMWANLGARVIEASDGKALIEAQLTAEAHGFPTSRGTIIHGGAIAALADCALATAGAILAGADQAAATADLKVDFFRPAQPGRFLARAEVRHRARRLAYCQATIEQEDGTVVAEGRAVMAYVDLKR